MDNYKLYQQIYSLVYSSWYTIWSFLPGLVLVCIAVSLSCTHARADAPFPDRTFP